METNTIHRISMHSFPSPGNHRNRNELPPVLSVVFRFLTSLSMLAVTSLSAEAPDYESMQRNLQEHGRHLSYMDFSLSNWVSMQSTEEGQNAASTIESLKKSYRDSISGYYLSQMEFMESDYNQAHNELVEARKFLMNTYADLLEQYILETESFYKSVLPIAVGRDDADARYYLQAGYRVFAKAREMRLQAYNTWPGTNIERIRAYRESLRMIRVSRRYLYLALINANLPRTEKPQYRFVSYERIRSGTPEYEQRQRYAKKVRYLLEKLIRRNLISPTVRLTVDETRRPISVLKMHEDNYEHPLADASSIRRNLMRDVENRDFDTDAIQPENAFQYDETQDGASIHTGNGNGRGAIPEDEQPDTGAGTVAPAEGQQPPEQ